MNSKILTLALLFGVSISQSLMNGSDCENADVCASGCCANGSCDEMKVCDDMFKNMGGSDMGDMGDMGDMKMGDFGFGNNALFSNGLSCSSADDCDSGCCANSQCDSMDVC